MKRDKSGKWVLSPRESSVLLKDPAVRKALAQIMLWGGATGDGQHPKVVKANAALGAAIDKWCKRMLRKDPRP